MITLNNGTLNLNGNNDALSTGIALAGNGTVTGSGTLNLAVGAGVTNTAGANVINVNLAQAATNGTIKIGGGTLTLGGNNTNYAGEIYNSGTLVAAGSGSALGTGVLSNSAGSVLDLGGQTYGNTITNLGFTMTNSSTTKAVLNGPLGNGAIWYMGLAPGQSIQVNGTVTGNHSLNFSGGGTLVENSPSWASSASATISASADSTVQLTSTSAFGAFGGFKMNDAHLDLNGATAPADNIYIGSGTTTGANLYNSSATTAAANGAQLIINTTGTYVNGGVTNNYSRGIVGAVAGSTLNIGDQVTDLGAGTNNTRGTLEVSGAGIVALTNNNNAYSTAQVDQGATLSVLAGANLGATNAIAVAGSLISAGALTLPSATTITIATTNATSGSDFGQITVNSGTLTYAGTLTLNVPAGSSAYFDTLFNFTSQTGDFTAANIVEPSQSFVMSTTSGSGIWTAIDNSGVTYTFTDATGALTASVPEPGTCAMVGLGLSALAVTIIRRRRND